MLTGKPGSISRVPFRPWYPDYKPPADKPWFCCWTSWPQPKREGTHALTSSTSKFNYHVNFAQHGVLMPSYWWDKNLNEVGAMILYTPSPQLFSSKEWSPMQGYPETKRYSSPLSKNDTRRFHGFSYITVLAGNFLDLLTGEEIRRIFRITFSSPRANWRELGSLTRL